MESIYKNGKIYTLNKKQCVEAMYIKDGYIKDIGTNEYILQTYPNSETNDLEGRCVIPGFNDSHLHFISPVNIELFDVRSIDDLVNMTLAQVPSELDENEWIIGRGWNHDYFDTNTIPTRYDLDRISTTHPVCLIRACGHIAVINSKALALLNISKENIPSIDGGLFNVDENGEPNGLVTEFAVDYVKSHFNKPSIARIKEIILENGKRLLSEGITSIQTDDFMSVANVEFENILQAYQELNDENKLPLRIYEQCQLPEYETLKRFLDYGYRTGQGNDFFKIGPLKLLLDGALGARTAWMSKPYHDDASTTGIATYDMEVFTNLVNYAHQEGMQIAVHGIGDQAIKQIIDTYIKAQNNFTRADARHGIVHVQITEREDLVKMADHRILAYVQPIFLHYDQHIVEERVGKELASTSYNFKTLRDLNAPTSFGTDSPVEPTNPFNNLYCAITRKDLSGTQQHGWNESECFTLEEALDAYTTQSAYASFEEGKKGKLLPDMLADFIILSDDIFEIDTEQIKELSVLKTVVNGEVRFTKQA